MCCRPDERCEENEREREREREREKKRKEHLAQRREVQPRAHHHRVRVHQLCSTIFPTNSAPHTRSAKREEGGSGGMRREGERHRPADSHAVLRLPGSACFLVHTERHRR